ncbi:MAG: hypothetical protein V1752_08745 [Candidatus Firestonebacteria bacterium]
MIKRILRYNVFISMTIKDALVFRAQFWVGLVITGLILSLNYCLWKAIYSSRVEIAGIHIKQMMTYIVVGSLVTAVRGNVINDIGEAFESGHCGIDLVRPLSFPIVSLSRSLGESIINILLHGLPVFFLGWIFIGINLPSYISALAFVISLILSLVLYFLFEFIFAQLIFYIQTYYSIARMWDLMIFFTSGALIPLQFLPEWIKNVLFVMPFQSIFYTSINIFLGETLQSSPLVQLINNFGIPCMLSVLLEQILWIIVMLPVAMIIWKFSSRRLIVQGG